MKKKDKHNQSLSSIGQTDSDPEVMSPRRHNHHLMSNSSETSDTELSSPLRAPLSPQKKTSKSSHSSTNNADQASALSHTELMELLYRVQKVVPENDTWSYKKRSAKINWEDVALDGHSAEFCQQQWLNVIETVKKTRTCLEITNAAIAMGESGKLINHLDVPKKWRSAAQIFFESKQKKFAKKHPEATWFELRSIALKKYPSLSDKKKQKFIDLEQEEKEQYKESMEKFEKEHADFMVKSCPKTTCAKTLYIEEKVQEMLEKTPEANRREANNKFRTKWTSLKTKKKIKYLKKAMEAKEQYDKHLEEYQKTHPSYKPPTNIQPGFLSKSEWQMLNEYRGKPSKPPQSGYTLYNIEYCEDNKQEMDEIEFSKRSQFLAAKWKDLTDAQQQLYRDRVREEKQLYVGLLEEYRQKDLSPLEQRIVDEEIEHAKTAASQAMNSDPSKKRSPSRSRGTESETKEKFALEPAKPPMSGFRFYVEIVLKDQDFPSKNARVKYASEMWNNMSTNQKKEYAKQKEILTRKYEQQLQEFKETLTADELERYMKMQNKEPRKRRSNEMTEAKTIPKEDSSDASSDISLQDEPQLKKQRT